MNDPRSTDDRPPKKKPGCSCMGVAAILGILVFLSGLALGPIGPGIKNAPESASMQTARTIDLAMFMYANDNDQKYPDGQSSTEVFQKLLDGNYISDPAIFFVALPGKVPPTPGQKKLRPENVSWDVTGGADSSSSDGLPLVFLTGFKVTYQAGGAAIPLVKPFPQYGWLDPNQSTSDWVLGRPTIHYFGDGGIAVAYKSNSARFTKIDTLAHPDNAIPNFVPPDFQIDGHAYRQLTPDGVLP